MPSLAAWPIVVFLISMVYATGSLVQRVKTLENEVSGLRGEVKTLLEGLSHLEALFTRPDRN